MTSPSTPAALTDFRVLKADHAAFVVRSLEDAISFWTEGLGAQVLSTGELKGPLFEQITGATGRICRKAIVSIAGQKIELLEYSGAQPASVPLRPFDSGSAHIALNVTSLDAVVKRVREFGWHGHGPVPDRRSWPPGVPRVMYLVGPDGATLELIESVAER